MLKHFKDGRVRFETMCCLRILSKNILNISVPLKILLLVKGSSMLNLTAKLFLEKKTAGRRGRQKEDTGEWSENNLGASLAPVQTASD